MIAQLPDKPTTIDWVAALPQDKYALVQPHLNPDSKKRELLALLPPGPTKKKRGARKKPIATASDSPGWLIECPSSLDAGTMQDVQEQLTMVIERFGLSMKPIEPVSALSQ